MAFKFSLESVLKYRRRLEADAQAIFVEAKARLDEALKHLDGLYDSVEKSRTQIAEFQHGHENFGVDRIRDREGFILGQGIRIQNQRQKIRVLMQEVEQKQEALVLALRERKSMEKLKEKRRLEFEKEQRRLEAQALDEISVIRFGRKT